MTEATQNEYLVISLGKWDPALAPETIEEAIDRFYDWHGRHVAAGTMKQGQRLAPETKRITKHGIVDGPFAETKEIIGGYWHVLAGSLEEAAKIIAENPVIACGLTMEIRPIDPAKGSAFNVTCETPGKAG